MAAAEKVAAEIAGLPKDAAHYGLTHGDFVQRHYLFHRGEVRAIDFEQCSWNHYLFDLASALPGIAGRPAEDAMQAALLNGYQQIRARAPRLKELLPVFTAASLLTQIKTLLCSPQPLTQEEVDTDVEFVIHKLYKFVDSKIKM